MAELPVAMEDPMVVLARALSEEFTFAEAPLSEWMKMADGIIAKLGLNGWDVAFMERTQHSIVTTEEATDVEVGDSSD